MDFEPRATHPNRKCDPDYNKEFNVIGKTGFRRIDGWEKVSGTAVFGRDFWFPGLFMPHSFMSLCQRHNQKHGYQQAEAYPGVRKVIKYNDNYSPVLPIWVIPQHGLFEGDPMGVMVIADTDEIAQDALRLIDIEWEQLPFVLECADALKEGAFMC
jgi:CO/xanthine dehydrogenase Mo-binding subunit